MSAVEHSGQGRIYRVTFEAAHYIEGHPKCGVKHGHSYHLCVNLHSDDLNKWIDFADIKGDVDEFVMKKLDHQDLGNASAEEISKKIADYLEKIGYHGNLDLFETEKYGVYRSF